MFSDAHCHLQDERLAPILDEALGRARDAGVGLFMCCGSEEGDWENVARIGRAHEGIRVSYGVHPWYIADLSDAWVDHLKEYLMRFPASGVGEIGLDFAVRGAERDRQMEVFERQLDLAVELQRPVSIHCRKAFAAVADALRRRETAGGVMHSWSGSPEMMREFETLGMYISFSGSITRTRNKRGHASVQAVSPDRLLLETDSPDLAPIGFEDRPNEPANLRVIAQTVARLLGRSREEVAKLSTENFRRLFS
jgi:TatD DNase family protein